MVGNLTARLRVDINAPDIWWAALVVDGLPVPATADATSGSVLRVFGRSLGWTAGGECVDARRLQSSSTTALVLTVAAANAGTPTVVPAENVSCYEAAFRLGAVSPARYTATVTTPWGASRSGPITVVGPEPAAPPSRPMISVNGQCGGNVAAVLTHAAMLPNGAVVVLGAKTYRLNHSIEVPDRTILRGVGVACTELIFDLLGGGGKTAPGCATPLPNVDLYRKGGPGVIRDVAYVNNVSTLAGCCAACAADSRCNGYTLMITEHQCILKGCSLHDQGSCVAAATSGNADRTSGFLTPFRPETTATAAAVVGNSSGWGLEELTVTVVSAKPATAGVLARGTSFAIRAVAIQLRQTNASSAVKIESARHFEVSGSELVQHNLCFWGPTLGMHDDATPFQDSATVQLHNASWGHIHGNNVSWKCSGYDMDVSSNMIFEQNNLTSTEAGVLPHGNSVSFYDYQNVPSSANWSFSHNYLAHPPRNNRHNWAFYETFTGDGSGGFGAGPIASITDGTTVTLGFPLRLAGNPEQPVGGTAMVCGGAGMG